LVNVGVHNFTSMLNKIFFLIACAILQPFALSHDMPIAPVFLHGEGSAEWSFGQSDSHPLKRHEALAIVTDELKRAKYSIQTGPLLLDEFATKEMTPNYVSPQDPEPLTISHPFFFDFFIPELGIAIKYIDSDDCSRLEYGEFQGIDYSKVDLIGAIQVLREKLGEISPTPFVVFYDPMSKADESRTIKQLRAQIIDFVKWVEREAAVGHLPFKLSNQPFIISENKKLEMRILAQDRTQKGNVRISAIEWLGAVRDQNSLSMLKDAVEDKDEWIRRAAISSLGQIGGNNAESLLISSIAKGDSIRLDIYQALDAIYPAWTKNKEAKEMLSGWDFDDPATYISEDDLSIAFQIDPEMTLKKSRELFKAGQLFSDSYIEFLRHCTSKELPLILSTLSNAIFFNDEAAALVTRLDPNWRNNSLARDAFKKQVEALLTLEDANDTLKMSYRITLLNYLNPQWRSNSKMLKQMRLFVAKIKQEATTSLEKERFIWAAMALRIKEADQLVALWWIQLSEDSNFRDNFIRSHIFFKQKKYISLLHQSLKWNNEDNEDTRSDVLMSFGEFGGPDIYPSIMRGLNDDSIDVRRSAAIAAGKQKLIDSIAALHKIVKTSDDVVLVVNTARALSQIGKPASVRPLKQALEKWLDHPEVACQIIEALSVWNTAEVESAMMEFLRSAAPFARESAENDKNKFYLGDIQPNAGVEGAIRWAVHNNRKALDKYITRFAACSSPRHRALAQAAAYYFVHSN
jgi:HEAT repeat protein